jgi:tetratricopeptide (TPR) repeat protein
MKLTLEMHRALASINAALMKGDQAALENAFAGVDVAQLLSQDTIAVTRALGKKPITLLLCTLAVENGIEPARAQHWLACYQSILREKLEEPLNGLSHQNVLRIALECLIQHQSLTATVLSGKKIKGTPQAWQDALELLLDHKDWTSALELLRHLGKQPTETQIWLQLARSLSRRHPLYVEESGQAQVDVDYQILARLYGLCADAARRAKVLNVYKALVQLAASALETDGDFDKAIDQLTALDPQNNTLAFQIDLARCFCKQGKVLASIDRLDRAIELLVGSQNPSEALSADALQGAGPRPDGAKAEKSFDVKKASRALSDLSRMANDKGTPVFLVSGTLLGYVREGQLLAHDKDIDVGIVGWENQYNLCMALQETGLFTVSTQHLKGKDTFYIPIKHNDTGMWIDVFVYHPQGNHWVTGVDFFFGYRQTFAFTPFELQEIEFLGVKMKAPANAELNLTENYGNWRVPDASYLSHLESPSTMDKGNLPYMVSARMLMLSACLKKQNLKIEKILSLMRVHHAMAGAMSVDLMTKIETAFLKPVKTAEEVCHA